MKLLLAIILVGQVLMATQIDFIEVKGVKVPFIYEEEKRLPIVSMQLVFRNSGSITDQAHIGLAKLSAKMMNEGTLSQGSIGFAKTLDAKAIHLSAHTGTETFVMEMGSLKLRTSSIQFSDSFPWEVNPLRIWRSVAIAIFYGTIPKNKVRA